LVTIVAFQALVPHGARASARGPSGETTLPAVRWLTPIDGSTVSGILSGPSCEVVPRDNVTVTRVDFYLDGSLLSTATTSPYSCEIDATALSEGTHVLKARAYDPTGKSTAAYSFVSTPPTGAPRITLTVQGDSLSVGSAATMPADLGPSYQFVSVSSQIGRSSVKGLGLLSRQPLGQIVVFALGTNDWWSSPSAYRARLTSVLRLIGPDRCLVVPTVWKGGRALGALNRVLHSLARRYGPRRMQLAPWAEAVAAGRVRLPDGTHPASQAGWQLRAEIVDAAVRACV
jgi:hypothetical protein